MKNIHLIPTDKPSKIFYSGNNSELLFSKEPISFRVFERSPQNIYITNDEEIKYGDWVIKISSLYKGGGSIQKYSFIDRQFEDITFKKIILTTDQDLVKDGVQAIDDEFLEWFVKNPSCEDVEVEVITKQLVKPYDVYNEYVSYYKIIIPKEEIPKLGTKEFNDLASAYFGGKPEQHIEFINNNIDEFDESLNSFKEKTKMSKYEKTKKILKIELSDNEEIIQIKLKPKYHKLKNEDKAKVLERLIRWGRDELNCLYPEQD